MVLFSDDVSFAGLGLASAFWSDVRSISGFPSLIPFFSHLIDIVFPIPVWSILDYSGSMVMVRYGSVRLDKRLKYPS